MTHLLGPPSPWVTAYLSGAPAGGRVLDVACGRGRHVRHALALGYRVTGIDRSLAGLADLAGDERLTLVEADLEDGTPWPFADTTFDAVIVTKYLWRPLFPVLAASVAADGLLIYETYARGNGRYGAPSNPDFLLEPGELIERVRPQLMPVAYQHVTLDDPPCIVARIVAAGPDHKWLNDPPGPQF